MKEKGRNTHNRIITGMIAGCIGLVICVSVLAAGFLHSMNGQEGRTKAGIDGQTEMLQKNVGAVRAEENLASGSTGNSGDNRKVIKIVEVVPDSTFSIFPYLIEWGSEEGYDENTPIGYEGVREMALSMKDTAYSPYTIIENAIQQTTLSLSDGEYAEVKETNYDYSSGKWKRITGSNQITGVNGYFEYVGNAKGLYEINLKNIVEASDTSDYGIRNKISVLARTGEESKKGDWEVQDAQYYWAGNAAASYPTNGITQQTDKNYDLKFTYGTANGSGSEYVYRPESVTSAGGEYAAVASGNWLGSYQYQENGNYGVTSYNSFNISNLSNVSNYYVRVSNKDKADGVSGLSAGYFRLYDENKDKNVSIVYQVSYGYTGSGAGSYVLNTADVSQILLNDSYFYNSLLFEYVGVDKNGEGAGNYDVTFIYTGNGAGTLYSCEILKITDGSGRYALTSSSTGDLYEYVGTGNGDYSKVVTRIDCAGIDYTSYSGYSTSGYYPNSWEGITLPGLSMGCTEYSQEYGNWVFHTVSSDEVNGYTMVSKDESTLTSVDEKGNVYTVSVDSPKKGDRIYVYGQSRYYRYYAADGFESNEWFKLLMYLSNADGTASLAADDYAAGILSAKEIKEKYEKELAAFDSMYRIDIKQVTPGQLTADDVKEAALLYFSTQQCEYYNMYESRIGRWTADTAYYPDDLSADALLAIYKYCLYDMTTALIYGTDPNNGGLRESLVDGTKTDKNLLKMDIMATLFSDPFYFSYFLEDYEDKQEDYSTVHSNAAVTYYEQTEINGISGSLYNLGNVWIMDDTIEIEPQTTSLWDIYYFRVVEVGFNGTYYEIQSDPAYDWQNSYNTYGGHFVDDDVNDENTWYIVTSIFDIFPNSYTYSGRFNKLANIWRILHNRKSGETSTPAIVVTNADGDNISAALVEEPIYYFYVDPYSAAVARDFDIDFEVGWTPEEVTEPNELTDIVIDGIAIGNNGYTAYTYSVAADFLADGVLRQDITTKDYEITAVDSEGNSDSVIVRFVVREAFMLN